MGRERQIRQLAESLKRAEREAELQPWSGYRAEKAIALRRHLARIERQQSEGAGQLTLLAEEDDNESDRLS